MASKIDEDRGVVISVHPTGMDIYMYKDDPGIYLTVHGQKISELLAKQAGFDTVRWGKEKIKKQRLAVAMKAIETELQLSENKNLEEVVKEENGFKIVNIGLGRHQVYDPDGNLLSPIPLPLEQAETIFDALVSPDKAEDKKDKKPEKAKK